MNILKCPSCRQPATKWWELFVFPSRFWISKVCRNCGQKIYFNWNVLNEIVRNLSIYLLIGIVLRFFSFNSIFIDAIVLIIALYLPFYRGKELFISKKDETLLDP
jgi:hypothetical protein